MTADDIRWTLAPVEDDPEETADLTTNAIVEAQAYRVLAQCALRCVHDVMLERDVLRGQRRLDRHQAARERTAAA